VKKTLTEIANYPKVGVLFTAYGGILITDSLEPVK